MWATLKLHASKKDSLGSQLPHLALLVTTVAGLVVGIIALFAYNFLVSRVNNVMTQLEAKTMEFMDLLNEPVN